MNPRPMASYVPGEALQQQQLDTNRATLQAQWLHHKNRLNGGMYGPGGGFREPPRVTPDRGVIGVAIEVCDPGGLGHVFLGRLEWFLIGVGVGMILCGLGLYYLEGWMVP